MSLAIPEPRALPILRHLHHVDVEAPVQSMISLAERLGPLFRLSFPTGTMVLLGSHELVDEVCDETRFQKAMHNVLREARRIGGDGLFTAHDDEPNWGIAHRVLMPALGPLALRDMFPAMLELGLQLVDRWERLGDRELHDVPDQMTRLTLDTIALCGFGFRFNSFYREGMHSFVDAMLRALREVGDRSRRHPLQSALMPWREQRLTDDVGSMQAVVDAVIRERRAQPEPSHQDLLARMLEGRDPVSGEALSDENIRNQIMTFLIAGHETTSGLLSFALYELLRNPQVLARAQAEVDRVFGSDPAQLPTFAQLAQLEYVDQVLRETLRLWPTAPAFGMTARNDTLLAGRYPVAKGENLLVLLPALHRDPKVWGDDAAAFRPERFAPALRERLPTNAYKPFGTGARACIGRPFAMQEATLVLALLLHRFDLSGEHGYQLRIKETLTLKPEGLRVRARTRTRRAVVGIPCGAPQTKPEQRDLATAAHGAPLLVLFGSSGGTSEALARGFAREASARGYSSSCAPLDQHKGKLPREGAVLIVCASYNGQPSHNARQFSDWLAAAEVGSLSGVRYALFGCGHRDWAATYQAVPRALDAALTHAGAARIGERGEGDAALDLFAAFEHFSTGLWGALEAQGLVGEAESRAQPSVEVGHAPSAQLARHGVLLAELTENRELVRDAATRGKSKRHLELLLPEGVSYRVGDYVRILPRNASDLVLRAAAVLGLPLSGTVRVGGEAPRAVHTLLSEELELNTRATPRHAQQLAEHTRCPPERAALAALADPAQFSARFGVHGVSLLQLLELFPAARPPLAELLGWWPALGTRRYSISSSPARDPRRCSLTLSVLDAPLHDGSGRHRGTASGYLARQQPGELLAVAVEPGPASFLSPEPHVPLIMICAGTGIAPFRGFVAERMAQHTADASLGPALLYFGCDQPDADYLYRDELEAAERAGVVQLRPTFCAAPEDDLVFVQHRLWREREALCALLRQGAHVRVCGDARLFAPAVREVLARILAEASLPTLDQLTAEGRFAQDVFG